MDKITQQAVILRDYMHMDHELAVCDIAIVGGSPDLTVPVYTAELSRQGYFDTVIFSGGFGKRNADSFDKPEAEIYSNIASEHGITAEIFVESDATHTGENITNAMKLINENNLKHEKILLIHKPYMERRFYATFEAQYPELIDHVIVSSANLSFQEYVDHSDTGFDYDELIHMLVGDTQRVIEYPAHGFQSIQEIPSQVHDAFDFLKNQGFIKYL